jgi:CRP-like cAMP-binding protein
LEVLAKCISVTTVFDDGEILMRQGEQITEDSMMHIILKGKVEVIFDGEYIGSRHKDDFVGEQALIGRLPRTATVKASGQVQCASISRKQFISLSDDVVRERNSHTPSEDTMPDDATTEQNNVWQRRGVARGGC